MKPRSLGGAFTKNTRYPSLLPFLLAATAFAPAASAATDYWDGTGTTWNNVTNWSTSSTAALPNPTTVPGAADTAIFNLTGLNTNQSLTLDAAQSISTLTLNSTGNININSGTSGSLSIGAGGISNTNSTTTNIHNIAANITLTANQTWTDSSALTTGNVACGANLLTITTTGATRVNGILSGTQGLVKNGAGNLILAGISTYSGPVAVNAGTLIISSSNALGAASSVTVANGAALELISSPNNSSAPLSLSGAGILATGALTSVSGTININNPINTTQAGNFAVGGTGSITFGGPFGITGLNSEVTKTSSGTLTLAGATDNVGMGLNIDSGTVILAKASSSSVHAVGADGIDINGGTLQLGGTGGDQIYDGGSLDISGGSFDTNGLSETVAFADIEGSFGVNNSGAILNSAPGNATLTAADDFEIDGDSSIGVTQSTATLTLNGAVNNFNQNANLTKVGLGTLIINGNVTLGTSNLTISAGTFISPSTLAANAVNNFGTFIYNGGTFTSRLVNFGTLTLNADFAPSNGLDNESSFTLPSGRFLSAAGAGLSTAGTFNLTGGTLILSTSALANNTNAGTFSLAAPLNLASAALNNSGTFILNGTLLNGPGIFNNLGGGVLTGSGSIANLGTNTITFTNAGIISPAGGTLTLPAFTNAGVIEMASPVAPLAGGAILNTGTIEGFGSVNNPVTNNGTIESTGGGNLLLNAPLINSPNGTLRADTATKLLMQAANFPTNAGLISLAGGTFDNGNSPLNNTGSIVGYGVLATGGLTNNNILTLTGGASTINGPVTNAAGKTINIKYQPAIFTGNITNNGTIKTTSTTVTFTGNYTGNTFISDPATNIFQGTATTVPGGSMTGSTGDVFNFAGGTFTNNGNFTNGGNLSVATAILNTANFTQTGPQSWAPGATFTNAAGHATFGSNATLYGLTITAGTVDITTSHLIIESTAATKSATLASLQTDITTGCPHQLHPPSPHRPRPPRQRHPPHPLHHLRRNARRPQQHPPRPRTPRRRQPRRQSRPRRPQHRPQPPRHRHPQLDLRQLRPRLHHRPHRPQRRPQRPRHQHPQPLDSRP